MMIGRLAPTLILPRKRERELMYPSSRKQGEGSSRGLFHPSPRLRGEARWGACYA